MSATLDPARGSGLGLDQAALQRRTVRVLVLTQAVGAVGITIGIATASLLARDISGSESQAGLAQTSQVLGAAVAAYLAPLLAAVVAPSISAPRSSSTIEPTVPATTASTAPPAPSR